MPPACAGGSTAAWSVRRLLAEGTGRLTANQLSCGRREAEWLLGRLLGRPPLELYLEDRRVDDETVQRFLDQVDRRATGTPLQYLLGEAQFFGLPLAVEPGVFIPRPETEAVTESALGALRDLERDRGSALQLLELGTGSGAIAVTLATHLPTCLVVAVEVSWEALQVAQANARRHGVSSRVHLIQGDWLEALRGRFDGIISNPPYVPSAQVERLPLDVRCEPRVSLDGGADGCAVLRHVLARAQAHLREGGWLVLECGETQARGLGDEARGMSWASDVRIVNDLARRPRGLMVRRGAR